MVAPIQRTQISGNWFRSNDHFGGFIEREAFEVVLKKIDLKSGIPEKIDGPVEVIPYEKRMPLEIEIEYFINHMANKKPEISNIDDGLKVVEILVEATRQILQ